MLTNSVKNTVSNKPFPVARRAWSYALWVRFSFVFFLAWACSTFAYADGTVCGSDVYHAQVEVEHVIDGDTVRLKGGKRLRFIGINTPELAVPEAAAEPFAEEAKQALIHLIGKEKKLLVRFDKERRDRYGRTLAHVFLPDNTSVEAWMLAQGLAAYIVEPPNLWQTDCYQKQEKLARENKLGIWSTKRFSVTNADDIKPTDKGFYVVQGRIKHIKSTDHAIWLYFNDLLAVRIDVKNLKRFKHFRPESLKSHFISVRGWIYPYGSELNIRIKHPKAMTVYD